MSPVLHLADLGGILNDDRGGEGGMARPPDVAIDLSRGLAGRFRGGFGVYQARFAPGWSGSEAVAACSDNRVRVIDIATRSVVLSVLAHADDINAVCFADPAASANVFISASDDGMVRMPGCPKCHAHSTHLPLTPTPTYLPTHPSSKCGIAVRWTRRMEAAAVVREHPVTFRGISAA